MSRQSDNPHGLLHKKRKEDVGNVSKRTDDIATILANMDSMSEAELVEALRQARGEGSPPQDQPI